jgi:hypothetical protein
LREFSTYLATFGSRLVRCQSGGKRAIFHAFRPSVGKSETSPLITLMTLIYADQKSCKSVLIGGESFAFPISAIMRDSGDHGDRRATPPPSPVIPDWRRLAQGHPRSSQIGVAFSDEA